MPLNEPARYDAYYFANCCGKPYERSAEWLTHFGNIAQAITRQIQPRTVLDAGCAMGFLVEGLRDLGVEAFGIDTSDYAIQRVRPDLKPYFQIGSVLDPFPRRYDLIVCIEVLEHIPSVQCEQAVASLCLATDDILFSSTPQDYQEATHFNVQPTEYWAELFAMHGFVRDIDFDASFITPWAVRFRRTHELLHRVVRDYERRLWWLTQENRGLRELTVQMRAQLAVQQAQLTERDGRISEQQRAIQALDAQLKEIFAGRGWRLFGRIQGIRLALIPRGSHREAVLYQLLRRLRISERLL